MLHNNIVFLFAVVYCLCSTSECGIAARRRPTKFNGDSELDCSQFQDDFDVLRQLPFSVPIDPDRSRDDYTVITTAYTRDNQTSVQKLFISGEQIVPLNIFCLSNLEHLHIEDTPFENDAMPDALGHLQTLESLAIYHTSMKTMTKQLDKLTNLEDIQIINCSLTSFPDIPNLRKLRMLHLPANKLSTLGELPPVILLDLFENRFTEIPVIKYPQNLTSLQVHYNPLESASHLPMYKNLWSLHLGFCTLTSIPRDIGQLQKLEILDIAGNNLTHLPVTLLDLPLLGYVNATKLQLPFEDIVSIKKAFRKSRPLTELFI